MVSWRVQWEKEADGNLQETVHSQECETTVDWTFMMFVTGKAFSHARDIEEQGVLGRCALAPNIVCILSQPSVQCNCDSLLTPYSVQLCDMNVLYCA